MRTLVGVGRDRLRSCVCLLSRGVVVVTVDLSMLWVVVDCVFLLVLIVDLKVSMMGISL